MGGGDLNAKKAWHPNTLKNQERVWKAEQAAAEEKKRIVELEHERVLEKDRAELNKLARSTLAPSMSYNDDRLHWMYEKPDKKVQQEEYLLGRAIDKNHEQVGKSEADEIPAVARRVVGSSMLAASGDTQVDLARKIREDPLLLVKERERAARAALLNNPVQRAKLTELLRRDAESKKEKKQKKKKDIELDNILAQKLLSLSGKKAIDLAALLASDDSGSESSDEKTKKMKKKKVKKGKSKKGAVSCSESDEKKQTSSSLDKKKRTSSESFDGSSSKKKKRDNFVDKKSKHTDSKMNFRDSSEENQSSDDQSNRVYPSKNKNEKYVSYWNDKEYSSNHELSNEYSKDKQRSKKERCYRDEGNSKEDYGRNEHHSRSTYYSRDDRQTRDRYERENRSREKESRSDNYSRAKNEKEKSRVYKNASSVNERDWRSNKRSVLSEDEKAAKLAEMAAAGAEREKQRERRVAHQLAEKEKEVIPNTHSQSRNVIRQLPDSLESRIHSNRHYIQRDQRHMNEHFAKR